jgi:hypothetical protein
MLETKQKFEDTVPTYKLSSVVLIRFYWLGKSFGLSKSLVIMDSGEARHAAMQFPFP